jgi:hypothetical protein
MWNLYESCFYPKAGNKVLINWSVKSGPYQGAVLHGCHEELPLRKR